MPEKKITIEINRASAGLSAKPKQSKLQVTSKGIIRARRENDFLARRLKSGEFINFYDLGEWLDNDTSLFVDETYAVIPTVSEINAGDPLILYEAAILEAQNKPLDIPIENWKTHFHKIGYEEAVKYRLSIDTGTGEPDLINEDNPRWTPQGLKMETEELDIAFIKNSPQFPDTFVYYDSGSSWFSTLFRYFFGGDGDFKVTSEPSYASGSVDINLTRGNIDIYIGRTITRLLGFKNKYSGSTLIESKALNHFYSALPKSIFGNDSLRHEREFSESYELGRDLAIALTTHPDARQFSVDVATNVYTSDGSPSGWNTTDPDYEIGAVCNYVSIPGMLLMAINKGADWYFIWWDS